MIRFLHQNVAMTSPSGYVESMKTTSLLFFGIILLLTGACSRNVETLATEGMDELEEGNPAGALKRFQKAIDQLEGHPDAALIWNAIGVAEAKTGREGQAETSFLTATDLDPTLVSAHINLGLLYQGQGRADEAFSSLSRAVQANKIQTDALEIQAVDAVRLGAQEKALEFIQLAVRRGETPRTLSSLAVLSSEELSVEERRELLQRAVSLDPLYPPAQLNLAAILDQHRLDPEQAQVHYENFVRLAPESPLVPQAVQRAQVMEARVLSGNIRTPDPTREEVEALLNQAADAADPAIALRYCLQAHALASRASRLDLRERALRAAATLAPESARAKVGLGRFLREQGRNTDALSLFLQAHQLAPQWPPAFSGAVILAAELGNTDQAEELLIQTLGVVQDQADSLLIVADLYAGPLQDERKAREIYRSLVGNFPDTDAATTAESRLNE